MDQFYIVKILGRGSEGQVLLAEHKKTHLEYAIKRLVWQNLIEANQHLNEANKLKNLKHKNIVKYFDVFLNKYSAETSCVCILLEYCAGGDLQYIIDGVYHQKRILKEEVILRYMIDICEGLTYLHDQMIIHRDLKPKNIFKGFDGTLKIGDFGSSKELTNSICVTKHGTPHFMSWEMLNDTPYTELTDIFSVGIILFQLMTGKSIMLSIELSKDPKLFDRLEIDLSKTYSLDLVKMIRIMTMENPKDRPSAKEVLNSIKTIHRNRIQGDSVTKESCKSFMNLDVASQMYVFTFLEFVDLGNIMCLCKSMHVKCEENLWKALCHHTMYGHMVMEETRHMTLTFKERIKFHSHRLNSIEKNVGKTNIGEIHPSKLEEASTFLLEHGMQVPFCTSRSILSWFTKALISHGTKYGRVYVCHSHTTLLGVSIWQSPYTKGIDFSKLQGANYAPFVYNWKILSNLKGFVDRLEKVHSNVCKDPHWTLYSVLVKIEFVHNHFFISTYCRIHHLL
jgi:serine/threonine protein kinase